MPTRILAVDDSKAVRTLLKRALDGSGYVVDEASNGAEGLKLLRQRKYDLIVMDLMMPIMNGLVLLRMKDAAQDRTPVIVLTAEPGRELTDALANECVMDYLRKPLDGPKAVAAIAQVMSLAAGDDDVSDDS